MTYAVRIYVPGTYPTIQSAINHAVNGDTIVVQPGNYLENINFKGKNIVLTSNYLFSANYNDVLNTIINGSSPSHADTASVVLFINHEDSTSVLNGFTLKNGNGTVWLDEHGAGIYREGGAILTAYSSPTISNNLIIYNNAINHQGISSAGGGGIRAGDGNPMIINNVIMFNKGLYGGGIVLNYCGAKIYNNIVAYNSGGDNYGGGGMWFNGNNSHPELVNNNTIVANHSNLGGGGVRFYPSCVVYFRNNIVWANTCNQNTPQIQGSTYVTYNNVEGGFTGTGNINQYPKFKIDSLLLYSNSPCNDAGDPSFIYNDIENSSIPGHALYPSQGNLRNDMGVYGGPFAKRMIPFAAIDSLVMNSTINFITSAPPDSVIYRYILKNQGTNIAYVDSIKFINNTNNQVRCINTFPIVTPTFDKDTVVLYWKPYQNSSLSATMLVYHKDPKLTNPFSVSLNGTNNIGINEIKTDSKKVLIFPNPSNGIVDVVIKNEPYVPINISVLDTSGREIYNNNYMPVDKTKIFLELKEYTSGIYFIKITFNNGSTEFSKFVIK